MKAPDKIYIPNKIDFVSATILKTQDAPDDIEYIRKDYLLEWAKEVYEAYRKRYEQRNALYYRERAAGFLKVIDKLNEI